MEAREVLFALLHAAASDGSIPESVAEACTPEMLDRVYTLANFHDLAHAAAYPLSHMKLPDCEAVKLFQESMVKAAFRNVQLNYEGSRIYGILDRAEIPYIPLKGSVLRFSYPQPWLRTSCDIDVLVKPEDLESARAVLEKEGGYTYRCGTAHDISLYAPNGVHLELHFSTAEYSVSDSCGKVLEKVWQSAVPQEGGYRHVLTDEMFYFYHMVHMARHLLSGGCGIRAFLDVWILNHRISFDPAARADLLAKGSLASFAAAVEKLADAWFSQAEMDADSKMLSDFVLYGGVYGTETGRVVMGQIRRGGKFAYAMSRIFQPYDQLKGYYPILKKYRFLTPLFQVVRWFRVLIRGRAGHSFRELRYSAGLSADQSENTQKLLRYLGFE